MTRVKICGVTTVEDAQAAVDAGADVIGLNFHPPTARFVELETARLIRNALGNAVEVVGVFVDRPPAEVEQVATELALDAVQLHGSEKAEAFTALPFPIVRALRVRGPESLRELDDWQFCQALLLDGGGSAGTFGGVAFDWSLAKRERENQPPLWLAGGLTPHNVAEAIRWTRPALVDVASGVESSPGRKDEALMRAFISAVREVV